MEHTQREAAPEPAVRIAFAYEHRYRVVDATRVWKSSDGHWLVTGIDVDKGEYRTFRYDRMKNGRLKILGRVLPDGQVQKM